MNRDPIIPTTILPPSRLTEAIEREYGVRLTIVSETFQRTGSFKFRAAWRLASRAAAPRVIAASSGNFGQALACACQMLGKRCTIVMPHNSASVKIDAVRSYGADADLVDVATTSRAERVAVLAELHPDARIASAYDDDDVIDGNATLGEEIQERLPEIDAVIAPVGGGGLTSGIVQALRRTGSPIAVVGAEPLLANDAARSLREGRRISHESEPQTLADGARTLSLGERNWAILQKGLEGIVEVPEGKIVEALRRYFLEANLKAEPTGALALGAILTDPGRFRNRSVAAVVSGGNVDPTVYAQLLGA